MMRAGTALLLLFTLALTLGFGVHPCGAMETVHPGAEADPQAAPAPPAMPSCHAQTAPAPEPTGQGRSEQSSSDHPCPHVCHATALAAVTPPFLTMQAVTALVVTFSETAFAVPARSIDHVPLT